MEHILQIEEKWMRQTVRAAPKHAIAMDRVTIHKCAVSFPRPAVRTFLNIAGAWRLAVDAQRAPLGWPA